MTPSEETLQYFARNHGQWATTGLLPLATKEDLAIAYTPGVALACQAIAQNPADAYTYTMKARSVAVISDGTSVLGLGDIGPMAGLPVMEGKSVLYKKFANIDAVPLVLASKNVDDIVQAVKMIAPTFGGIHLEDIAAPACFEIEKQLAEVLDIPVMHDDQHATAIVTLAALFNALRVVEKDIADIRVVINGAGAAGMAIAHLLRFAGVTRIDVLDTRGLLAVGREGMNAYKDALAQEVNPEGRTGLLADVLAGADVVVGVSKPGMITQEMVRSMAPKAIVFALANPVPEIMPSDALAAGAAVVATGRSDFPNQINNVLVYPGLFRGLLDARARKLTMDMKLVVARALAQTIHAPTAEYILPNIFNENPAPLLAQALKDALT